MSVLVLRALVLGAMSRGIDAATLAERAGVPPALVGPETLGDPDGRVLAGHVLRLWWRGGTRFLTRPDMAKAHGCPRIGPWKVRCWC